MTTIESLMKGLRIRETQGQYEYEVLIKVGPNYYEIEEIYSEKGKVLVIEAEVPEFKGGYKE